ncbi:MAG: hypothetical protein AAF514_23870, partial [Verrucomicrobiota bacterium]
MKTASFATLVALLLPLSPGALIAQEPEDGIIPVMDFDSLVEDDAKSSSWDTKKDARIINLSIPAPRGQIVDRYGKPLA